MGFFSKLFGVKNKSEKVLSDRELISENQKSIDAIIILAEDSRQLIASLNEIKEQIKYLTPSDDSKVIDFDKDIKGYLEDLRTAITKSDDEKTQSLFKQIKLAIADRNVKL